MSTDETPHVMSHCISSLGVSDVSRVTCSCFVPIRGRFHGSLEQFSPPPPDVVPRLTWRTDDTKGVIEKRLKQVNRLSGCDDVMM